jgi:regulator of cell morphogenesis and NO signaling
MINLTEQTLASLVSSNHQSAAVLEKYQLDFCCKGKRTLADACKEKGLNLPKITTELEFLLNGPSEKHLPFEEMTAEQLIGHILIHHHFYVKQALPRIRQHIEKVAYKHGENFPYMIKVYENFVAVYEELSMHMEKEELILFPRIKEIERHIQQKDNTHYPKGYLTSPINVMEQEHEHAGSLLNEIRVLTNNYSIPESACTTFRVTLAELKEFEEDLHKHVHLENYILFPKAEKMVDSLSH